MSGAFLCARLPGGVPPLGVGGREPSAHQLDHHLGMSARTDDDHLLDHFHPTPPLGNWHNATGSLNNSIDTLQATSRHQQYNSLIARNLTLI